MGEIYLELGSIIRRVREEISRGYHPMTDEETDKSMCPRWRLDCDCDNPLSDTCEVKYV